MAEVCVQFKGIGQQFFAIKYRNFNLESLVDSATGKFTLLHVRRLLYNFGHLILSQWSYKIAHIDTEVLYAHHHRNCIRESAEHSIW